VRSSSSAANKPDNIPKLRWQIQDGFARNQVGGKPQIAKWTDNAGHDHQLAILRDDDGTPVAKWTTKDAAWRVVHMIDGNATDLVTGVTFGVAYRRSVDHHQAVMAAQAAAVAPPAGYFILNQREVRADDDGYNDVEGQRYHWTSQSSGAWKRLSVSPGARFVYYRPGTASDGTAQTYFGTGAIGQVSEQEPGDFVATIADYLGFERPVPSSEGPSVNHQTSILPIAKGDFDKLVRLGDAGTHARLGQKVWIFQANPQLFDLLDFLTEPSTQPGTVDSWLLRKHDDEVSDDDTVLLWTAGKNAGIYATGTIVGESFMRNREDWEPTEAPPESRAIRYRLEHILLDRPVLRRDLINHPVLKDLSVIRQPQGTNFPVTEQQWEALRPLIESPSGTQATPVTPPQRFDPSDDLEWLLRETLWSRAEVDDVLDTLRTRRPQIILAGPPGTGKTWVAERIGRFLTGGQRDAVHIVQFHPSYAYEDFVEGLRPVAREGQVAFEVVPGALVKVADHARRVGHPVVLVIDEMNRANLPSVFGELLYLLEYRDKEIRLLHRDRFSLPPNLYVIGTMNTADRSIRSVDTALRRRFDIFECPPRPDILDAYYRSAGNNSEVFGLAEGLRKLNDLLTQHLDHHHTVGHSFFMAENFTNNDLRRTWLRQIRPLIDEYFFDQPDLVQQFDLTMFWPRHASL
jgi:AAA domain (dynein-related subfamily)/EVE domain